MVLHTEVIHYQQSLQLQALEVERHTFDHLLKDNQLPESAYHDLDAQLDFQIDAIDYPGIQTRTISKEGLIDSRQNFRKRILKWRQLAFKWQFMQRLFHLRTDLLILERYALVRARLIAIKEVFTFLDESALILASCHPQVVQVVAGVRHQFQQYWQLNQAEMNSFIHNNPQVVKTHQRLIQINHFGELNHSHN